MSGILPESMTKNMIMIDEIADLPEDEREILLKAMEEKPAITLFCNNPDCNHAQYFHNDEGVCLAVTPVTGIVSKLCDCMEFEK